MNLLLGQFNVRQSRRSLFAFVFGIMLRQHSTHSVLSIVEKIIDVKGERQQQQEHTKVHLNLAIERCVHVLLLARDDADQVGSKAIHVHLNSQQHVVVVIVVFQRRNDGHVAATIDAADLHEQDAVFALVIAWWSLFSSLRLW